MQFKLL
jgi:hypothetical protein